MVHWPQFRLTVPSVPGAFHAPHLGRDAAAGVGGRPVAQAMAGRAHLAHMAAEPHQVPGPMFGLDVSFGCRAWRSFGAQNREVQAGPGDARSTPGSARCIVPHSVVGGQERLEDQHSAIPVSAAAAVSTRGLVGEQQVALRPGAQRGSVPDPWLVLPVSGSEGGSAMRASSPVGAFMTVSVLSRQSVAVKFKLSTYQHHVSLTRAEAVDRNDRGAPARRPRRHLGHHRGASPRARAGAVTMSQIAAAAGIGRATLYKYFPDVEAILVAWHDRHINRHRRQLAEARDAAATPADQLEAVLTAFALIQHQHHDTELPVACCTAASTSPGCGSSCRPSPTCSPSVPKRATSGLTSHPANSPATACMPSLLLGACRPRRPFAGSSPSPCPDCARSLPAKGRNPSVTSPMHM